jgi:hypothetical protein
VYFHAMIGCRMPCVLACFEGYFFFSNRSPCLDSGSAVTLPPLARLLSLVSAPLTDDDVITPPASTVDPSQVQRGRYGG